jgi:hypothetical protein
MSYFNCPRLHFSGRFKASPSTINNTPNNYDPAFYPSPNELQKVELYWNPKGDGGFAFADCVVTRVDYADGTSSTTPEQDPIVGQPVASLLSSTFPLSGALVDLDPMQQNVSEIWAMTVQIGGAASNLTGSFAAVSFYAIWGQAQGQNAPHSSASGAGVYQSTLRNTQLNGGAGGSKFLQHFADNPTANLSINFNVNTHNNRPPIWRFNDDTFAAMRKAQPPVPDSVLAKIQPMQQLVQNLTEPGGTPATGTPAPGSPRGDVPAQDFVLYMLKQYLSTQEFNDNINTILAKTALPYTGSTTEDFLFGLTTGTIGPATTDEPVFFVRNRMMNPQPATPAWPGSPAWYAPFVLSDDGKTIQLNLGNSLPTELPGTTPWAAKLGQLWLVAFSGGTISVANAHRIKMIPYDAQTFINQQAGIFTTELDGDYTATPLGLLSISPDGIVQSIVLAEHPQGYYLRSDQFVFRMNPGFATTPDYPRGNTTTAEIHALQWGNPVPDNTEITVTMMTQDEATNYTNNTLGTGGSNGIKNLSVPREALKINGQVATATAGTSGGVARFDLSCTPPGNPRGYVNGQVYFLNYAFADPSISTGYIQDADDILSVVVYDESAEPEGPDILAKFGRLYKIMSFLTDETKIAQIDLRNMIKLLLEKPFTEVTHMPVTRDLAEAERAKIIAWINTLNNS